jgi:hypothetical protein
MRTAANVWRFTWSHDLLEDEADQSNLRQDRSDLKALSIAGSTHLFISSAQAA